MQQLFDSVMYIIGGVLPNVNDMELIREYGLLPWIVVFIVKLLPLLTVLLILFLFYRIVKALHVTIDWEKEKKKKQK